MNKVFKRIINYCLKFLFLFVRSGTSRAKILGGISKRLFSRNNSLEYDATHHAYWLKHNAEYLFMVKKPYYNFSKKNLYKSIEWIYCRNYIPGEGDVVVDIGAGIGTEMLFFHEKLGEKGKLFSIEASRESYSKLTALCEKNKIHNSQNFNLAISGFNGKIWMEETENFEVNQVNTAKKGIEIDCLTLDEFVKRNAIPKIDLLKVNIEGAELEIIKGMKESMHLIQHVAVSCHDFLFKENKRIRETVSGFLTEHGFEISYNNTGNKVTDSWIYAKKIK
jgi:FkbM family methyltransferase